MITLSKCKTYYYDENNNRAYLKPYFRDESAINSLKSLVRCKNCIDCRNCTDCNGCEGCEGCEGGNRCIKCLKCFRCTACYNCENCSDRVHYVDSVNCHIENCKHRGEVGGISIHDGYALVKNLSK